MTLLVGLPAVARRDARVLILGSMPGARSLEEAQYYAHPRNAFWTILAGLINCPAEADYLCRLRALKRSRLALWDVVRRCRRLGSLDSAIDRDSIEINDFRAFFASHPRIERILLNGGVAAQLFHRHVGLTLSAPFDHRQRILLPSTSPANASWSLARKREAWLQALQLEDK